MSRYEDPAVIINCHVMHKVKRDRTSAPKVRTTLEEILGQFQNQDDSTVRLRFSFRPP
jgi:hypothetical protein